VSVLANTGACDLNIWCLYEHVGSTKRRTSRTGPVVLVHTHSKLQHWRVVSTRAHTPACVKTCVNTCVATPHTTHESTQVTHASPHHMRRIPTRACIPCAASGSRVCTGAELVLQVRRLLTARIVSILARGTHRTQCTSPLRKCARSTCRQQAAGSRQQAAGSRRARSASGGAIEELSVPGFRYSSTSK
jgi:hypothetical protein